MSDTATRIRAPRGTKTVSDAFFVALRAIPEARQTEVARAAQIAIRDELKVMRDRSRAAATKAKQRRSASPAVAAPEPKKKPAATRKGPVKTKPSVPAKTVAKTPRAKRVARVASDEAEA